MFQEKVTGVIAGKQQRAAENAKGCRKQIPPSGAEQRWVANICANFHSLCEVIPICKHSTRPINSQKSNKTFQYVFIENLSSANSLELFSLSKK